MCFGLLTYISLLVTEQATVYTALNNIMTVLAQLNKESLLQSSPMIVSTTQ